MSKPDQASNAETGQLATLASRWWGLFALALGVVRTQTTTARGRTVATVLVVALTVANLLLVTGVALALADDEGLGGDADARIVADDGGIHGSIAGAGEPRLGESRERAARLADRDGVDRASPVLEEPIRTERDGEAAYLAAVGVDTDHGSGPESATVADLPLEALADAPTDAPVVLSRPAADELGAEPGDRLVLEGVENRAATVVAVEDGPEDDEPVALVELGVLQSVAGADEDGLADAVLVWGDGAAIEAGADATFSGAVLEGQGVPDVDALFGDGLALATSALALAVSLGLCSLLVATTAGMRVEADRRTLATLGAVGFPTGSRLLVVATTTLATAVGGALLGVVLGVAAIGAANALATATIAPGAIAALHPLLVPYALAVAVASTLVALPYPLALAARTDVLAEVGR